MVHEAMTDARSLQPWKPRVDEAAAFVRTRSRIQPGLAVVLGSGLGALADAVERDATIPYREIPHFPVSTAAGHAGNLVLGRWRTRSSEMRRSPTARSRTSR